MVPRKCLIFKESPKVPKVAKNNALEVWRFGGGGAVRPFVCRIPPLSRSFKKAYPLQRRNIWNIPKLSCDINGLNVPFLKKTTELS